MRPHRARSPFDNDSAASARRRPPPHVAEPDDWARRASASLSTAQALVLARLSERIDALDQHVADRSATSAEAAIAAIRAFERTLDRRLGADQPVGRAAPAVEPARRASQSGAAPLPATDYRLAPRGGGAFGARSDLRRDTVSIDSRPPRGPEPKRPPEPPAPAPPKAAAMEAVATIGQDLEAARDFASALAMEARKARDPGDMQAVATSIALLSAQMGRLAGDSALFKGHAPAAAPASPMVGKGRSPDSAADSCVGLSAVRNLERQVVRMAEAAQAPRRDPALEAIERSLGQISAQVAALQAALPPAGVAAPASGWEDAAPALQAGLDALKTYQGAADRRIQATLSGIHSILERLATRMPTAEPNSGRGGGQRTARAEGARGDVERFLAALHHLDLGQDADAGPSTPSHRRESNVADAGLAALDASLAAIKANFLAHARRS